MRRQESEKNSRRSQYQSQNQNLDRDYDRNYDRYSQGRSSTSDRFDREGRYSMGRESYDRDSMNRDYLDRDFDRSRNSRIGSRDEGRFSMEGIGENRAGSGIRSGADYSGYNNWTDSEYPANRSERRSTLGSDRSFGADRGANFNSDRYAGYEGTFGSSRGNSMNTGFTGSSDRWDSERSFSSGRLNDTDRSFQSDRQSERSGFFGKGPKGWKRSDERIREEVCEALYRDSQIDASNIDVKVKDGMVTLSGTVESREIKRAAEQCVENLSGVDDVQNELRVGRATTSTTNSTSASGIQSSSGSKLS